MRWPICTALVGWCLFGGVAQADAGSEDEGLLRGRVVSFWQAEAQKDYITSYQLMEPSDRKSTRLNSSHIQKSRMPSSA